jgi:hypothetical protein
MDGIALPVPMFSHSKYTEIFRSNHPLLVFTCVPVCMLNLVSILLMLFEVVCWKKYVTTSVELFFCFVTLRFRYIELLVCYTMTIWSECFSWVLYFKRLCTIS